MRILAVGLGLYLLWKDSQEESASTSSASGGLDPLRAFSDKGGLIQEYDPAEAAHIAARNPPPPPEAGSREWTDYLAGCAKTGVTGASVGLAFGPMGALIGGGLGCVGSVGMDLWDEYG